MHCDFALWSPLLPVAVGHSTPRAALDEVLVLEVPDPPVKPFRRVKRTKQGAHVRHANTRKAFVQLARGKPSCSYHAALARKTFAFEQK